MSSAEPADLVVRSPAGLPGCLLARLRTGLPAREVDLDSYRLLVGSLFASPTSILMSNGVGTLVAAFCYAETGHAAFVILGLCALITLAGRCWTVMRYLRVGHDADDRNTTRRWDMEYLVGATIFAVIIGLTCLYALAYTESFASHIITVVCSIAFGSGYVARNAGRPYFVIGQLLCLCGPMMVGLCLSSEKHYGVIALYIALYILTNVSITFSLNRNLLALAAAMKESKTLARTLERKNATLDAALNSMTHGLVMFSRELNVEVSNSKLDQLLGMPADHGRPGLHLGRLLADWVLSGRVAATQARSVDTLLRQAQTGRTPASMEVETVAGQTFVLSVEPAVDEGILVLIEDATQRKATAAQIERMAHFDSLTGLCNRFTFGDALRTACDELKVARRSGFCVLYVDLDNFKNVNDSLGHEAGDSLLIEVAARLRATLGPDTLMGRFGGDEFVVLCDVPDASRGEEVGRRVVEAIAHPVVIDGKTIHVTTSIGLAVAGLHGEEPTDILRAADIALYAAKGAGRNTVMAFAPSMAQAIFDRREIENDLRIAAQSGQLSLYYQPIIDLGNRRPVSCEALMRWHHPVRGLVPSQEFIAVAEETGLITQMGEWALVQACQDAAGWPDPIGVAVNVSPVQFREPDRLIYCVRRALAVSGLAASRLELEVTESLLIEDEVATLKAIKTLRRLGVRVSLDDFGTGYSSLAYLARFPFSKVKIDRTFARHVTSDGPSRSIIEVVCQLAKRLDLQVVVEGIETREQETEVVSLGADQAQGYHFSRPLPLAELAALYPDLGEQSEAAAGRPARGRRRSG